MDIKKSLLSLAVRVYPQSGKPPRERAPRRQSNTPEAMFVFDTETRTDATQRLMFGSYRFYTGKRCLEEGIFHADDLTVDELDTLKRYVASHKPETVGGVRELRLLTRDQFAERLYLAAYKGRCLLVGFNLPFDLSRIALGFGKARQSFLGGFSLDLWSYLDKLGVRRSNHYRPRLCIKQIDSKRALKGFTSRNDPDTIDLVPEDSATGEPDPKYTFRGHFLDLRTLTFALTDIGHSLKSACEAFGVEHGKETASQHGVLNDAYIDYNRRDVVASAELAYKLLEEYEKHPIPLQATKAFSPASIGKGYLRAMGIRPILERQSDFPKEYLGFAQSAFYGGRASAHIRKVIAPVVYTDFLSMYPTVNSPMGLWDFVIADKINVIKDAKAEIEAFLDSVTADDLFKPEIWKRLTGFVKVIPDGEILPTRANYNVHTNDWQVAVNHLYANPDTPDQSALWFTLPDVIAAKILTGRVPKIVDAFRIEAVGCAEGLATVKLRSEIEVDPAGQDLFRVAIEERQRLRRRTGMSQTEKDRTSKTLKVTANATGYGIYAEMIRHEAEGKVHVTCHAIDAEAFECDVLHPDNPGEYCFPPLASLITGAARLMLALLEHSVTELGGTYAMEDTDSMAIVATERGGLVPCPNGISNDMVTALSWKQVQEIVNRFAALNPYSRDAVPGSILKIEEDNFDPKTGKQRQLYCYAISAKRYVLFLKDRQGLPELLRKGHNNPTHRWSQHGLGHLLNPTDVESDDREWNAQIWENIVLRDMGLSSKPLPFEHLPAVARVSVSSPAIMKALAEFNNGKPYSEQIKPFNFMLSCQVRQLGHPLGVDPTRFHLIAPFDADPRNWLTCDWIDQYSGKLYRITTEGHHGGHGVARVKTYGEVLREHAHHPEAKCADAQGETCSQQTIGLLQRRHVTIDQLRCIGKESNKLEDVGVGLVHCPQEVYTEYCNPTRDEWITKIVPALNRASLTVLVKLTGLSKRGLIRLRQGQRKPHSSSRHVILRVLRDLGLI